MMRSLPIYLHTLRKSLGFTQGELAFLLHIHPTTLSRTEQCERTPTGAVLIGAEVVFGESPRDAFPAFHDQVEARVLRRAAALYERLEANRDPASQDKCRRLLEMIERARLVDTDL